MDPLTEIIAEMRIRKATFRRLESTAPWAWTSQGEQGVKFVLIVRGSGVLTTASQPEPIRLRSGDVFIMLDDEPYGMYDHEDSLPMPCREMEKLRVGNRIEAGGGGALTSYVLGFFEMDPLELRPLVNVLPPLLHLKLEQNRCLAFHSVLELLAGETEAPGLGSDAVISRLFELLFVHAIRAYSAQPGGPCLGWLAAISDRNLARAIDVMHREPATDWTLDLLAKEAGVSRSTFAVRFKTVVGATPLDYLTRLRIYRASRQIQRNGASLSEVARSVGYESMAAFNRVFKRETGVTPGAFRKAAQASIVQVQ